MSQQPKRPIYDISAFTTLDYPDHLAAIIWFNGCNMRCDYCYNRDIVLGEGKISISEALAFLMTRRDFLEGVVLSGGECTLFEGLEEFCRTIKEQGFKIKLDTNGLMSERIIHLVESGLIDYVALDYKAPKEKFRAIAHAGSFEHFKKTLAYLINSPVTLEVRTTLHTDLLDEKEINTIIGDLVERGYKGDYFLQQFIYDPNTFGGLREATKLLDMQKISDALRVVYRKL